MKKILALGSGKIGGLISIELAKKYSVTNVDVSHESLAKLKKLEPKIECVAEDALNITPSFLKGFDLVISGVPGFMGFEMLRKLIEAKKDVVDISFLPEDHLSLNSLARANGVTAIVDAGLAPGLSNFFCGHLASSHKDIETLKIFVGGVPKLRFWPFQYKAPFSFVDVMEEYTRPARIKLYNHLAVREPLSDVEIIPTEVGSLEAFYTDGVRSLLETIPEVPTIIEKTLRYPGYAEYINVLKSSGFFSKEEIQIKNEKISVFDFTSKVLDKEFRLNENDEDIVVLKIIAERKGETFGFELVDRYCQKLKKTAMARTTGFTATACAELILQGMWKEKRVSLMEHIGRNTELFDFVLNYLKEREVNISKLS